MKLQMVVHLFNCIKLSVDRQKIKDALMCQNLKTKQNCQVTAKTVKYSTVKKLN